MLSSVDNCVYGMMQQEQAYFEAFLNPSIVRTRNSALLSWCGAMESGWHEVEIRAMILYHRREKREERERPTNLDIGLNPPEIQTRCADNLINDIAV